MIRARGTRLPEEEAVMGQTVAAIYTDTRVYSYRYEVVSISQ